MAYLNVTQDGSLPQALVHPSRPPDGLPAALGYKTYGAVVPLITAIQLFPDVGLSGVNLTWAVATLECTAMPADRQMYSIAALLSALVRGIGIITFSLSGLVIGGGGAPRGFGFLENAISPASDVGPAARLLLPGPSAVALAAPIKSGTIKSRTVINRQPALLMATLFE